MSELRLEDRSKHCAGCARNDATPPQWARFPIVSARIHLGLDVLRRGRACRLTTLSSGWHAGLQFCENQIVLCKSAWSKRTVFVQMRVVPHFENG
jgi:hypothetical protein